MMRSLTRYIILVGILHSLAPVAGQNGIPYISYYESHTGFESQNWSVCQDSGHAMYFANKQGVSVFDGLHWHSIKLPHVPLEIGTAGSTGDIYVLSGRNYGMLKRTNNGTLRYEPLTFEGELDRSLKSLHFSDTSAVFYGTQHISFHSLEDQSLQMRISSGNDGPFAGMVMLNEHMYVNTRDAGLHEMKGDSLIRLSNGSMTSGKEVLFWLPYDNRSVLLGLEDATLLLFDGRTFREYPVSDKSYLENFRLSDGVALNDSLYVFSTYYGGAIIINRKNGVTKTILNYQNGLPDDEVYAIGKDHSGGIWLTYRYGICRVDPLLPIREYTNYPGLEGLLTNTVWYKNTLYVATTEGLFSLEEVKDYSVTQVRVKQPPREENDILPVRSSLALPDSSSRLKASEKNSLADESPDRPSVIGQSGSGENSIEPGDETTESQEKRGFFERLFNRGKRRDRNQEQSPEEALQQHKDLQESNIEEIPQQIDVPVTRPGHKPRYVTNTVRKVKAVRYRYRKVKGINSGCMQLHPANSSLLVGSSSGLYAVQDSIAVRLSDSRNISSIHAFDTEKFYVVSEDGLEILHNNREGWYREKKSDLIGEPLFSVTHDKHFIWLSGYNRIYRLSHDPKLINAYSFDSPYPEELQLKYLRDTLFLFSGSSVEFYAATLDSFLVYDYNNLPEKYNSLTLIPSTGTYQWLRMDNQIYAFASEKSNGQQYKTHFGLFSKLTALNLDPERGYWIIDDNKRLFQLLPGITDYSYSSFKVNIEHVQNASGEYADLTDLTFLPEQTPLQILLSAPCFPGNDQILFQYMIENRMETWSDWSATPELTLFLESGQYMIYVRARNVHGKISEAKTLYVTIKTPFYKESWFFLSLSPILFVILYVIFHLRERKIKRDKKILEEKVNERTLEISEQKKQIELQKDAITDSITYASNIQRAILPSPQLYEAAFGDYFIYFRPRDIVSGDFYWITERDDQVIFTVADCTGHGVPGAFMSMLGNSFLNEITKSRKKTLTASGILNQLRVMITAALSQSGSGNNTDDGMDIALCIYNRKTRELNYSGANSPLYLVRNKELHIFKPNRMPIGYFPVKKDFTGHTLKIEKDDVIYLFTDGYSDQFGGKYDKKFTTRRFKKVLLKHVDSPMIDQKEYLDSTFEKWKDGTSQVDDVLVMGIRF